MDALRMSCCAEFVAPAAGTTIDPRAPALPVRPWKRLPFRTTPPPTKDPAYLLLKVEGPPLLQDIVRGADFAFPVPDLEWRRNADPADAGALRGVEISRDGFEAFLEQANGLLRRRVAK